MHNQPSNNYFPYHIILSSSHWNVLFKATIVFLVLPLVYSMGLLICQDDKSQQQCILSSEPSDKTLSLQPLTTSFISKQSSIQPSIEPEILKNWLLFSSPGDIISTHDWRSFSSTYTVPRYSLYYPPEWVLDGTIFKDRTNKKVAELLSGLIYLKDGQTCYDTYVPGEWEDDRVKFISKDEIAIHEVTWIHLIDEIKYESGDDSGVWYSHTFCTHLDKYAFQVTFYEEILGKTNIKLMERILSTFSLIPPLKSFVEER